MMAVAWSLSTEEQFYVVWPFVERMAGSAIALPILGVVLLINQLVNFGLADSLLGGWIGAHRGTLEILQITFTPMCLGVALAHLLHNRAGFRVLQWLSAPYWSPVWISSTLFVTNLFTDTNLGPLHRPSVQIGMTLLLASCVITERNGLQRVLTHPILVRIGVISYGNVPAPSSCQWCRRTHSKQVRNSFSG